jgi:hypothetical protein
MCGGNTSVVGMRLNVAFRKFTNTYNPFAVYNLEGNGYDSSGRGNHLTLTSPGFRQIYPGMIALVSGTGTKTTALTDFMVTGDITIQLILCMRSDPIDGACVVMSGGGELESGNSLWQVYLPDQNTCTFFSESGNGVDQSYSAVNTSQSLPATGSVFKLDFRRKAGVGSWFLNGDQYGTSFSVGIPTGGSLATFRVRVGGSNQPEIVAIKLIAAGLTDGELKHEYNDTMGSVFGVLGEEVKSLWAGALKTDSVSVVADMAHASDEIRLAVSDGINLPLFSPVVATKENIARTVITGLTPDTEYTYWIESQGAPAIGPTGSFRTLPVGAASFKVAFSGDAFNGSNHACFDTVRAQDPLMFIHLGDAHYWNIATNSPHLFEIAYDQMLWQPRQAGLYANVPTAYVWDDHDYGADNSNGSSLSKPAAASVYRKRVPHYTLPNATSIYQTWDIGRVRFVITDQRSAASANSTTDNSSKTMLGTTQKTWFKNILSNSPGMLIVWICPRLFGMPALAGADDWGGFSTERRELANHIKANCHGRVVVLSADLHSVAIDDGTNHDFATGGGEPLKTFQASPIGRDSEGFGGVFSHGEYLNEGQFGTMEIVDIGGASIDVVWKGITAAGVTLVTYPFTVTL